MFKNLSIGKKLACGFALVLSLGVGVGVYSLTQLSRLDGIATELSEEWVTGQFYVTEMQSNMLTMRRYELAECMETTPEGLERRESKFQEYLAAYKKAYEAEFSGSLEGEEQPLIDAINKAFNAKMANHETMIKLFREGKLEEGKTVCLVEGLKLTTEIEKALDDAVQFHNDGAKNHAAEAKAAYRSSLWWVSGLLTLAVLVGSVTAWFIARLVGKPIAQALKVLEALAKGDLTQKLEVDTQDEMGRLAAALNSTIGSFNQSITGITENATSLATASEELTAVSSQMSANAEETSAQANVVSAAAEQVSKNIQTVATAAEEMSASIKEISKNATEAARVATDAVKIADTANTTVSKLGDSSQEIGNVIKLITSIAQQTNLLALNATIEAARAGEAGKGFAVVANEVKELAKETTKATEDISQKIAAIQGDTQGAVEAIKQIGLVINQVNDISNTIASAVEEQTATTNEIGRNITEAAKGSTEIAQNITGMAQAAQGTSAGAGETAKAATGVASSASELQRLAGQFKTSDTAAARPVPTAHVAAPMRRAA